MSLIQPMPPYQWQQQVWQTYQHSIHHGHLSHAYLLTGAEGIGVEDLARAMGQYLLCSAPVGENVCGKCRNCLLLQADTHPDLLIIEPEEKSVQIKVDQVRKISDFVNKTAQQGGYKVVIINPAEAMNINAANALLKNLEEPAGATLFILVCKDKSLLLPTIKSRCSILDIGLPETQLSTAWLQQMGVDEAEDLLVEAGGAPLVVKKWLEEGTLEERNQVVDDLGKLCSGALSPMLIMAKWNKFNTPLILEVMQLALDSLIKRVMAEQSLPEKYQPIVDYLGRKPMVLLFKLRDRIVEKRALLNRSMNLNETLVVEEVVLDWQALVNVRNS